MYVKKAIDIPLLLTPRCKLPSLLDFRWPKETTEPLRKNNKQDSFSLTDFIYPLLAYVSHATTDWETNISQYLL